ncbi:N-acetylglucosamine-6-phosphate deacetylase [Inquilinus limosus]|uniref:N-acetylglucosamine-6-phosphate deacetylase n=1 Tax=Inquilinus limosus TaxID=171674 RepID=A0A211ZKY0_9PROT|nr:amidohydrolase family protein [Inquilinus limosus]OWJ65931.1 N-acetylglucosamine-6-phosphate deacetylase [Inquilinus limosus]
MITGRDPASGRSLAVTVADGRVAAIEDGPAGETAWLSAGLVDLQVNGFAGHDLNGGGLVPETVARLAAVLRRDGVTTFLPTLITASEASITAALAAIAAARAVDPLVAHAIPAVHVEGPHISPEDGPRGAHPRDQVRPPDLAEFDRWQAACDGLVGLVTLSPHHDGAPDYIRGLVARGVHVSIGHTDASPAQIAAAVAAGAALSTHLGNGIAATLPRHPNPIWSQLAEDRLTASFIADGHHLPAEVLKAMLRAKGLDRAVLVSDAAALGGLAPGLYDQPIGGRVELTVDGRLGLAGTPFLAGAARPLKQDVALAIDMASISLADALRLATVNTGRFVGGRGVLAVGAPADLVRFRWAPGDRDLGIDTVLALGEERA